MKKVHVGDEGCTQFFQRYVPKYAEPLELLGELDELVATLCLASSYLHSAGLDELVEVLEREVSRLSKVMSYVAGYGSKPVDETVVRELEKMIDDMWRELGTDFGFTYPTRCLEASLLNLARTVCRRVERRAAKLLHQGVLDRDTYRYLNRLSDLLFVAMLHAMKRR